MIRIHCRLVSPRLALTAALMAGTLIGCQAEDQETGTLDAQAGQRARAELPEAVVAQLDSGSAAYREGEMEEALRHYRTAADQAPEVAAAWFGIYMVHNAAGNAAAADSALARVRELAPGATLIHHPEADDTTREGGR